jgi:hypothetical protein
MSPSTAQFRKGSYSDVVATDGPFDDDADDYQDRYLPPAFSLKGIDRWLPPTSYRVVTDEELIEGLSFPAYRRVSTAIFVPAESGAP